jgi:hypothetical protein
MISSSIFDARKYENAKDLYAKRDLWVEYLSNTGTVINELKRRCDPILSENFDVNMESVVMKINQVLMEMEEKI